MTRVMIAAGGTAGHVVPALAVADALRARGADIEWIGGERAEAELVPAAGYELHTLRVAGLDRRNPLRAARAAALAVGAVGAARRLLRARGADAVLGGGGYVSGPVGLAAATLRLPLFLTEADSHVGVANRMLAPLARRLFLAFPVAGREGDTYPVTGRPVPAGTGSVDRAEARRRLGLPVDGPCLLVFGGSLGARRLNEAAVEAFGVRAPCVVLHASGRRDYEDLRARLGAETDHYRLVPYVQPFADALAAADLVAARSGGSVWEVVAAGVPSILVPYPHATADHQAKNARFMAAAGAAVVVPDAELDGPRLASEVEAILGDPIRLEGMSVAAREVARPDAADRIAHEVLALTGA
ncbi:MAG: undecaprenyldiphospho-muramoylpentapeptide beta-N-acetylglucosaminyltransferase [Thermoleophilaceae bacterium]